MAVNRDITISQLSIVQSDEFLGYVPSEKNGALNIGKIQESLSSMKLDDLKVEIVGTISGVNIQPNTFYLVNSNTNGYDVFFQDGNGETFCRTTNDLRYPAERNVNLLNVLNFVTGLQIQDMTNKMGEQILQLWREKNLQRITPLETPNGTNKIFSFENSFMDHTTKVYINKLPQFRDLDYYELTNKSIEFVIAPKSEESIYVEAAKAAVIMT